MYLMGLVLLVDGASCVITWQKGQKGKELTETMKLFHKFKDPNHTSAICTNCSFTLGIKFHYDFGETQTFKS